jgi:hypothetical protein
LAVLSRKRRGDAKKLDRFISFGYTKIKLRSFYTYLIRSIWTKALKGRSIFSIAATEKEIHRLRDFRRDWVLGKDVEKKVALELPG